jgi:hypothetical protein
MATPATTLPWSWSALRAEPVSRRGRAKANQWTRALTRA